MHRLRADFALRFLIAAGAVFWCSAIAPAADPKKDADPDKVVEEAGVPIDLLARVRLPQDSITGDWRQAEHGYENTKSGGTLRLNYLPKGEYDIRVTFTRKSDARQTLLVLNYRGTQFTWVMAEKCAGFGLIDGKRYFENSSSAPGKSKFTNGVAYTTLVKVRKDSLAASIDGRLISEVKTNHADLSLGDRWSPGDGPLTFFTGGVSNITSAELIPLETAKEPTKTAANAGANQLDRFLQTNEKAADAARARLVQAIDRAEAEMRKSKGDPDFKRIHLEHIQQDREAFKNSGRLPDSEELLDEVVAYLEQCGDILKNVSTTRKQTIDKEIRKNSDNASYKKPSELEVRLTQILGTDNLTAPSTWHGSRQGRKGASKLTLHIGEVEGPTFKGQLNMDPDGGKPVLMRIQGKVEGGRIALETTEMVRGDRRYLTFTGYHLGDRIIANVDGVTTKNKRAGGWVTLWKGKR